VGDTEPLDEVLEDAPRVTPELHLLFNPRAMLFAGRTGLLGRASRWPGWGNFRVSSTERNWRRRTLERRASTRTSCTLLASNLTPHLHTTRAHLRHGHIMCQSDSLGEAVLTTRLRRSPSLVHFPVDNPAAVEVQNNRYSMANPAVNCSGSGPPLWISQNDAKSEHITQEHLRRSKLLNFYRSLECITLAGTLR
jgi:hypothetical protein